MTFRARPQVRFKEYVEGTKEGVKDIHPVNSVESDKVGTVWPADGSRGSAASILSGKGPLAVLEEIVEDGVHSNL